jgi:hypothetical protein
MIETPVRSSFAPATRAACNGAFASSTRAGSASAKRWLPDPKTQAIATMRPTSAGMRSMRLHWAPHRQMLRYLFHDRRAAVFNAHAANVRAVTVALRQRVELLRLGAPHPSALATYRSRAGGSLHRCSASRAFALQESTCSCFPGVATVRSRKQNLRAIGERTL